jgi:cyclopropane-fatty-acyl-phospholipid synthase
MAWPVPGGTSRAREQEPAGNASAMGSGGLPAGGAAATIEPLLALFVGHPLPVSFELWDGSVVGPQGGPGSVVVHSPEALRHALWAPGELGLVRAYVAGALDVRGDLFEVLRSLRRSLADPLRADPRLVARAVQALVRLRALGPRPRRPPVEASARGRLHSRRRDSEVITHHYDIGNDFYRLVLGPSMTYSCARFAEGVVGLDDAQAAKHDLVCRKLGLHERPGSRLLDVGCGWGSTALHAARHYGAHVVGVTLSAMQAELARRRVHDAGLEHLVEVRLQDYRDLRKERFDAICSIGMSEHVGKGETARYFALLHSLLAERGRLLNHAISSVGGSVMRRRSFIGRYVFPDGELLDVGEVVLAMERAGFEVRDVESLREHYSTTLHAWVENLEMDWERAVELVGVARARVWRLYMAAAANTFDDGGVSVHQVLGVKPSSTGRSSMPTTRRGWQ